MKLQRKQFPHLATAAAAFGLLCITLSSYSAWSQPARTIKFVVPFPPGGASDVLARVLGQQLAESDGQSVVVENRPGAGTIIATEAVSRAAPDGTTLLFPSNSFVINPNLRSNLAYDPLTSFAPICLLVKSPLVLVVNSASGFRTFADFLAATTTHQGGVTLGAIGPATGQHIAVEQLKLQTKGNFTYVPYPGGVPAVTALLGGHITSVLANYAEVREQVAAGKLRPIAVAERERIASLPDVPTIAESGVENFEASAWIGVVAPAKTPDAIINRLSTLFASALKSTEVQTKLNLQALSPVGTCGADYALFIRKQYEDYGRIIREANIKAE